MTRLLLLLFLPVLCMASTTYTKDFVWVSQPYSDTLLPEISADTDNIILLYRDTDPNSPLQHQSMKWSVRALRMCLTRPEDCVIIHQFNYVNFLEYFYKHWLDPYTLRSWAELTRWYTKK